MLGEKSMDLLVGIISCLNVLHHLANSKLLFGGRLHPHVSIDPNRDDFEAFQDFLWLVQFALTVKDMSVYALTPASLGRLTY
jgi:hypothetical protein